MAETFHFAEFSLSNSRDLIEDGVSVGVDAVNSAAVELARINKELVIAREGTAARASLLDARDATLNKISQEFGITASFDQYGAAEVRLTGSPIPAGQQGPLLVAGNSFGQLVADIQPDGTTTFNVGGAPFSAVSGALAGRAGALANIGTQQAELDAIAAETITRANAAQAAGSALDGSPGQPLFSGNSAATISLALTSGDGLALAPAGAPAGSRDTGNLTGLIAAFGADDGPITKTDRLLLSVSSRISGLDTTRQGLAIINAGAQAEVQSQTGVNLDEEATNLIRLQQAFEANSRVIRVATEIFDTILGLN
jgi:flagellar hook-associated protein 1 FlgK